jgi:hypothetical protein
MRRNNQNDRRRGGGGAMEQKVAWRLLGSMVKWAGVDAIAVVACGAGRSRGWVEAAGEPSEKTLGGCGEGCWAVWEEVMVEKEKVGRAAWFLQGCGCVS